MLAVRTWQHFEQLCRPLNSNSALQEESASALGATTKAVLAGAAAAAWPAAAAASSAGNRTACSLLLLHAAAWKTWQQLGALLAGVACACHGQGVSACATACGSKPQPPVTHAVTVVFMPWCCLSACLGLQTRAGPFDTAPAWTLDQIAGLAFGVSASLAQKHRLQRHCVPELLVASMCTKAATASPCWGFAQHKLFVPKNQCSGGTGAQKHLHAQLLTVERSTGRSARQPMDLSIVNSGCPTS
jgi:hypothetical protein